MLSVDVDVCDCNCCGWLIHCVSKKRHWRCTL